MTRKHFYRTQKVKKSLTEENIFICEKCNKTYNKRNSLWYHKKKCYGNPENNDTNKKNKKNKLIEVSKETMVENTVIIHEEKSDEVKELKKENQELKGMINEILHKMTDQSKTIQELIPKIGNNNNNNFNLNVFLNETCKDAINIDEFVETLKIGMKELEYAMNNNIEDSVKTLMIEGLGKMEINKRPIHCTDKKRKTLYIKDDDTWERNNKAVVRRSIQNVQNKHLKAIQDWVAKNPDWRNDPKKTDEYMKLITKIAEPVDDKRENKIITEISKSVEVKDDTV